MSASFPTHHVEAVVQQGGALTVDHLPFRVGQAVDVFIVPHADGPDAVNPCPLRGTPVRYHGPFEPVAADEWDAMR